MKSGGQHCADYARWTGGNPARKLKSLPHKLLFLGGRGRRRFLHIRRGLLQILDRFAI